MISIHSLSPNFLFLSFFFITQVSLSLHYMEGQYFRFVLDLALKMKPWKLVIFRTNAHRRKATGFLKCFGIFPFPTLLAEAERGGKANSGRDVKEVG